MLAARALANVASGNKCGFRLQPEGSGQSEGIGQMKTFVNSEIKPGAHLCWVFVEAGLQAGQADLKVGLYTNTSELRF